MSERDREMLVRKLRAFSRRHPPRSMERGLMRQAAEMLEADGVVTVESVERALGGKSLLPWQKKVLTQEKDE